MARAHASTVIDQNVDVVWDVLRDFTCVGRWIPGAQACDLVASEFPTNMVRRIVLADGTVIDEPLLTLDDVARRVRYTICEPLPRGMRTFLGTARLLPITDGDRTLIEWTSEFDCDEAREAKMIRNISGQLALIVAAAAAETGRKEEPDPDGT